MKNAAAKMASSSTTTAATVKMASSSTSTARMPVESLIPGLPDEMAVLCLARVPRSDHPTLRQISRSIRALVSSPHFFETRSLIHSTENFIYLRFVAPCANDSVLYAIRHSPVPDPSPIGPIRFLDVNRRSYVLLNQFIYAIDFSPSRGVSIFDCRFNRGCVPAPEMSIARQYPCVGVMGGKIYVIGGVGMNCIHPDWAVVFDPAASGGWESVPTYMLGHVISSIVLDDKFYLLVDDGHVPSLITFDPRLDFWTSAWDKVDVPDALVVDGDIEFSYAVVNGVLFGCDKQMRSGRSVEWFDSKNGQCNCLLENSGGWNYIEGLEGNGYLSFRRKGTLLANVDGRLVAFMQQRRLGEEGFENERDSDTESERNRSQSTSDDENYVWCAEIDVINHGNGELYGDVRWCHKVLAVPKDYHLTHCFVVAL